MAGKLKRKEITYLDGVNTTVGDNISKAQELAGCKNARSLTIGYLEKRQGYRRLGSTLTATANYGIKFFDDDNASSSGFYRISTVGAVTSIYYLNTSSVWTALSGGGTGLTSTNNSFFTVANKKMFIVNGTDANRYISSDGTTVVTSATDTGDLYSSPIARKISYYKEKLYLADITIGSTRYQTTVMFSSKPVGIISLVEADVAAPVGGSVVSVTDTKYIKVSENLDIYRGGSKVADIMVSAKTESTITIGTITLVGGFTTLYAADEIWVDGTYTGTKIFRWADNPQSGVDVKQYDTFKFTGGGDYPITLFDTVGDVLLIGNKYSLGVWNDSNLRMLDYGIGCCSERGYTKTKGLLFFVAYDGIYACNGSSVSLISAKIQKYFSGATKSGLEAAAMGKKGNSIICHIGTVTLYNDDGSVKETLTNVAVEYNIQQKNFFIHTGVSAAAFETYIGSSDPDRLIFADSSNYNLYEMFYGGFSDDQVTSNKEVAFQIDLGQLTMGSSFESICYPLYAFVEVKAGSGIGLYVSIDDSPYQKIEGELSKGCTKLIFNKIGQDQITLRGRTISLSLREMSSRAVKIGRIAFVYEETTEEDNQRD